MPVRRRGYVDVRASWGAASSAPTYEGTDAEVLTPGQERARHAEPVRRDWLLQFRVFRFGLAQDGDFGVCVFPEGEEVLVGHASFGVVALEGVGAG
jgi:hypothetical protein